MSGLNFTIDTPPPPVWEPLEASVARDLIDVLLLVHYADSDGAGRLNTLAEVFTHIEGINTDGLSRDTLQRLNEVQHLVNDELARSQFEHLESEGAKLQ